MSIFREQFSAFTGLICLALAFVDSASANPTRYCEVLNGSFNELSREIQSELFVEIRVDRQQSRVSVPELCNRLTNSRNELIQSYNASQGAAAAALERARPTGEGQAAVVRLAESGQAEGRDAQVSLISKTIILNNFIEAGQAASQKIRSVVSNPQVRRETTQLSRLARIATILNRELNESIRLRDQAKERAQQIGITVADLAAVEGIGANNIADLASFFSVAGGAEGQAPDQIQARLDQARQDVIGRSAQTGEQSPPGILSPEARPYDISEEEIARIQRELTGEDPQGAAPDLAAAAGAGGGASVAPESPQNLEERAAAARAQTASEPGWFSNNWGWLLAGAGVLGVGGYFASKQLAKSAAKELNDPTDPAFIAANPYQLQVLKFVDPAIEKRSDIKSCYDKVSRPIRFPNGDSFRITTNEGAQLGFFKELIDYMEAVTGKELPGEASVSSEDVALDCMELEQQLATLEANARAASGCNLVTDRVAKLRSIIGACRMAESPELSQQKADPKRVSEDETKTIQGLIKILAMPVREFTYPGKAIGKVFRRDSRRVLTRIFWPEISPKVNAAASELQEVRDSFNTGLGSCSVGASAKTFVQDLSGRLTRVKDRGERIFAAGNQENKEARNVGLRRLPLSQLTRADREFIALFIGGLFWRLRGGGLLSAPKDGTNGARDFYHKDVVRSIAYLNSGDAGLSNRLASASRLAITEGWGKYMDMGRTPGEKDRIHDLVYMTGRGRYQGDLFGCSGNWYSNLFSNFTDPLVKILRDRGYFDGWLRAGVQQMGPCYDISWSRLPTKKTEDVAGYRTFFDGPTAWGEVCTGAAFSLGLTKALLR
jgi:hypothetical protein